MADEIDLENVVHDARGSLHAMSMALAAIEREQGPERRDELFRLLKEEVTRAEAHLEVLIARARGESS